MALNLSSLNFEGPSFTDNGDSLFTAGSLPILDDDPVSGVEFPMFDELNQENYASSDLALDVTCSSDPPLISQRSVRSRNDSTCILKSSVVYLPENFKDLSAALQSKIFQDFMCPSSRFEPTYVPVCSSPDPDDTQVVGYLTGDTYPIHYTLLHSLLSSYSYSHSLLFGYHTNNAWAISDLDRCLVLLGHANPVLLSFVGSRFGRG